MGMQLSIGQIPEDTQEPVEIERRETLLDSQSACGAALDILNEMLLFDKLESGALILHKQDVHVSELVKDSIKIFAAQAREKSIELLISNNEETMLDPVTSSKRKASMVLYASDQVSVDKTKVIQVIRNVVSNALKFTPASGKIQVNVRFESYIGWTDEVRELPRIFNLFCGRRRLYPLIDSNSSHNANQGDCQVAIEMSLGQPSDPPSLSSKKASVTGELVIEIKDNGVGISEENQDRLFKEVVQFSPELLQNGGGSGLGMCISRNLMDMHGGTISVHSAGVGHGSLFTLRLPMVRTMFADDSPVYTPTVYLPNTGLVPRTSVQSPTLHDSPSSLPISMRDAPILDPASSTRSNPACTGMGIPLSGLKFAEPSEPPLRFLVVDDSKMNRKMLCRLLQNKGHLCAEAEDGLQAVAMMTDALNASSSSFMTGHDTVMHRDIEAGTSFSGDAALLYDAVLMDFM